MNIPGTLTKEDAEKLQLAYIQEARLNHPIIMPKGVSMSITMLSDVVAGCPKPDYKVVLDDGRCHCKTCNKRWDEIDGDSPGIVYNS